MLLVVLGSAALSAKHLGLLGTPERGALLQALARARSLPAAPLLFVLLYVAATALALPGSILTLAGGALFGTILGTALNWAGATAGATLAYLIARALGQDAVRHLLGHRYANVERIGESHGFRALLRLRLVPVVPFNLLNYAAGLTGVRPADFVIATALGILPGTAIYTYFADTLIGGVAGARERALTNLLIAGGLLMLLTFAPALARRLGWRTGPGAA